MNRKEVLEILHSNSKGVREEAVRILVKIAENVLKNPNNLKVRSLQKSNATISNKILKVKGGLECLKLMGFQENETCLTLPINSPIEKVREVKNSLLEIDSFVQQRQRNVIEIVAGPSAITENRSLEELPRTVFRHPPYISVFSNPFLKQLEANFHQALAFDDESAKRRAKALIPVSELEIKAQENLRNLQEEIKLKRLVDSEYSVQDMLVVELMHWFKEDFFDWVDTLDCQHCGGKTVSAGALADTKDFPYTNRVEVHKCENCQKSMYFPRYNDLNILLETRRGRCGEWAKTFTLCCKAMGWDARFVVDELDHVWTEVYSPTQKRWIHYDPCEDVADVPLLYESGWNKQHTYIIAYSPDEIQDVTWRYSSNHRAVLRRRRNCTESDLVNALIKMRSVRQEKFSQHKKNYLNKRVVAELMELLCERKIQEAEKEGRTSGSLAWRRGRGETRNVNSYIWKIEKHHIVNDTLTIRYSTASDLYEYILGNGHVSNVREWNSGVFTYTNIFRKEEKDWKTVYLARNEGTDCGTISWKFQVEASNKVIEKLKLKFDRKLYENGSVTLSMVCDNRESIDVPEGDIYEAVINGKFIVITAKLSGGKGNVAWQHAQLFRQSVGSSEFPFSLTFTLKNV